jgi:putative intracellular protease/amidase
LKIQDILNAGGKFVGQEVFEDKNLITSGHPGDLPVFIKVSVNRLQ